MFAAIHETMDALQDVGAIDKATMRHFDEACLASVPDMTPEEIRALRAREQRIAARLRASSERVKNLVSDGERGVTNPGDTDPSPLVRDRRARP